MTCTTRVKFWIVVATFPLWGPLLAVYLLLKLAVMLTVAIVGLALSASLAALGRDELADRVANATGWEDDGSW